MKTKKSLVLYFSVVALLVILCYGLKTTFAFFVASEQGTATNIQVAKLTYKLESTDLENNALTLKPNEVKKINIVLTSEYDIATIYRLNYIGNVNVEKASTSTDDVKNIIEPKASKSIDLVITNNTLEEQTIIFEADGGYVGNELANGNITNIYNESLLQNKLLINGTLTLTDKFDYRDLIGTNNYIKIDENIYRVIGVFTKDNERYIKIISEETIGTHLYGENNNYLTSTLNNYLNIDYKESLNSLLKESIKEVTYYTSGLDKIIEVTEDNDKDKLTYYDYERGVLVADETFNQNGLSTIGLMYLSDYEYAEIWLNKPYNETTLVPNTLDKSKIFCITYKEEKNKIINDEGKEEEIVTPINEISLCPVTEEINVRPVMYLENKLIIESGTGTKEEPYIVKIDATE